jgi:hypothetical protein
MIPTIQRMTDVAQLHRGHPHLLGSLPVSHPIEEDPLTPLLLGLGALGQIARSAPDELDRLALVGADVYLLIAMLAAGRLSPPPTEGDLAALAIEQLERYTGNPNGERWRSRPPLEHLMRAFGHWTAVAPVLSLAGGGRVRGLTRMQLADLANYLTFFLTASGALDRLPAAAATG